MNAKFSTGDRTASLPPGLPLTPLQSLFVTQSFRNPNSTDACTGYILKMSGTIDIAIMKEAADLCIRSNPILRSQFTRAKNAAQYDQDFMRVEQDEAPISCLTADLSQSENSYSNAQAFTETFILQPYPITDDFLVRFCIFKLENTKHHLIIGAHHAILDGSSLNFLANQWLTQYLALLNQENNDDKKGTPGDVNEASFQEYIDTTNDKDQSHFGFWKEKLATTTPLTIASDAVDTHSWNTHRKKLSTKQSVTLRKYCRQQGITPSFLFKSLYGLLIQAYANADSDFIIMEVNSDRPVKHQHILGCYIQKTPVLFPINLLIDENSHLSTLFNHLTRFWRLTKPYRNIAPTAFQKITGNASQEFCYNYYRYQELDDIENLSISHQGFATPLKNTIQLIITESVNAEFTIHCCHYDHDYKDFTLVNRLLSLINQIIDDGISKLKDLSLLTNQEKNSLCKVNNTKTAIDLSHLVHHRFENICHKNPDKVAVIEGTKSYSYKDINQKANKIATTLLKSGVKKGDRVGVLLPRTGVLPAVVLGIFKIGACYIPIDWEYPKARIHHMIKDAQPKVILVEHCYSSYEYTDTKILTIDHCLSAPIIDLPITPVSSSDNAYIIYTSGSTGLPKGAINHHGGLINHIEAEKLALNLTGSFNMLQNAPISSDISVWQILGPLTCGGTSIILKQSYDIATLLKLIKAHAIDVIEAVPVVVAQLIEYLNRHKDFSLEPLQYLMMTGERASAQLINQWLLASNGIPITNAYGPSETSDDVTQHTFHSRIPNDIKYVSIGKPLANIEIYVVDSLKRLLPPHYVGEIAVAGTGVGYGYINNPNETEARFVSNPFSKGKLYLTGDLGWWSQTYCLHYKNRLDYQLNVKGQRIEPLEIEHTIRNTLPVNECIVSKITLENGEEQLTAHYTAKEEICSDTFQQVLLQTLPGHMVPSLYLKLNKLPLTPAGKIDRNHLPPPNPALYLYVAPENPTEEMLVKLWEELLNLRKISTDASFLALGGNSLIATKMIVRLRDRHNYHIDIKTVLKKSTIRKLAAYLATI